MCQFFSAILTRDGDVRFCEDDSHETILARLGWPDDRPLETRGWVRVECVSPHDTVRVDETSVPAWYYEDAPRDAGLVMETALRVAPARATYDAARATAWATYKATRATAQAIYDAVYASAWTTYNGARASAWATYKATCAPAQATCEAACASARATYDGAYATAEATCNGAISAITGYVATGGK